MRSVGGVVFAVMVVVVRGFDQGVMVLDVDGTLYPDETGIEQEVRGRREGTGGLKGGRSMRIS